MADQQQLRRVLAQNLRTRMAGRGIAVTTLADFAGVSVTHLYDVLGARKAATTDFLAKVAAALELEPWELLRPPPGARSPGRREGRGTASR